MQAQTTRIMMAYLGFLPSQMVVSCPCPSVDDFRAEIRFVAQVAQFGIEHLSSNVVKLLCLLYCDGHLIRSGYLSRTVTVCHGPNLEEFGTPLD